MFEYRRDSDGLNPKQNDESETDPVICAAYSERIEQPALAAQELREQLGEPSLVIFFASSRTDSGALARALRT